MIKQISQFRNSPNVFVLQFSFYFFFSMFKIAKTTSNKILLKKEKISQSFLLLSFLLLVIHDRQFFTIKPQIFSLFLLSLPFPFFFLFSRLLFFVENKKSFQEMAILERKNFFLLSYSIFVRVSKRLKRNFWRPCVWFKGRKFAWAS